MPNIYEVNVKGDEKYDCREKVPNIYEVNVKGDGKYDCMENTIVGKRRLTFTIRKC